MRPKTRQVRARPVLQRTPQRGIVLIYALFVVILILILGLSFMQTSALETLANTHSVQHLQATAAAEYGIARARAMGDSPNIRQLVYDDLQRQSSRPGPRAPPTADTTSATLFSNQALPNFPGGDLHGGDQDLSRRHGYLPDTTASTVTARSAVTPGTYRRIPSRKTSPSFGWLTNSENGVWFITGD